jgi:diguanylate cyclase
MKNDFKGSFERMALFAPLSVMLVCAATLVWMNGVHVNADLLTFGFFSDAQWQLVKLNASGEVLQSVKAPVATAMLYGLTILSLGSLGLGFALSQRRHLAARGYENDAPTAEKLAAAGAQIESELTSLSTVIRTYIDKNMNYSGSLAQINTALPALTKPEQVRKVIVDLISENKKVQSEAASLKQNLEQSRTQIEELRSNLAEAQVLVLVDPLTSLSNRRWLDNNLSKEISEAKAQQKGLCLVMTDIDHFKRINDSFGHQVGDDVLQRFASLLTKNIKGRDSAVRYGGEEFAIVLPQTKLDGATQLAEQVRRELEAKKWVMSKSGQQIGKITASFGVTELRNGESSADLIGRADANLYEAKRTGRNKVVTG